MRRNDSRISVPALADVIRVSLAGILVSDRAGVRALGNSRRPMENEILTASQVKYALEQRPDLVMGSG